MDCKCSFAPIPNPLCYFVVIGIPCAWNPFLSVQFHKKVNSPKGHKHHEPCVVFLRQW